MARLPQNVERLRDGGGYRFRAYTKGGWVVRLKRDPSSKLWHGYTASTDEYVGCGKTLAEIAAKAAAFITKLD